MIVLHCINIKNDVHFDKEFTSLSKARAFLIKIVKGNKDNIICDNFDVDTPTQYNELIYWYYRQPNNIIHRRTN